MVAGRSGGRIVCSDDGAAEGSSTAQCLPTTPAPTTMTIEISKETHQQLVASIERYFREHMEEKIGNVAAGALLGYFIEELGPIIYNKAVADVQERLQARIMELDIEAHEAEFPYWHRSARPRKSR